MRTDTVMKFALDEYANLNSPIHRWDVRYKLIGLISLMFAFATVNSWYLIPLMLFLSIILYGISRLPLSFLANRLRYPGFFLLGVIFLLPFLSGQTIVWQLGFLTIRQEGCLAVILIVSRFFAIMTTCLVLFGTSSFLTTLKGMSNLGISPIITDMLMLSYRYLFELSNQLKMMLNATKLRGFKKSKISWRNLSVYAALTSSIIVRSYQQAERVYKAMLLRGYGNLSNNKSHPQYSTSKNGFQFGSDVIYLFISLIVAVSLIVIEMFLG
ncbi:MAG: cobalt ECF transporter T component CbiQ [Trichodesmium sp. St16_bin4-tuft]|nr:cobalt ECF transporter T component CbiQ [Trichodesmium sp. St4_bin8_1]MDE5072698.1 cobalt ECF transporter T component CbiQ [Trichodesmium sp. St5_bin8]MDE5077675.1 cobalt ECF transporter T component CbiQ [Trichodesmium sp. St2_bin6]MDE5099079.1 cobalt ECF transporter T component CbiQ [Trichodesmium sp. St16_bin4-tuft]MDE5102995.1 cobalt ECF transporter T component CbiQ [Trichodesmium sp. St19_bin2]